MHFIRFKASGITTSFRDLSFRNYHRTYLAPVRTHIIGLLTNISRGTVSDYYDFLDSDVRVSVVVESLTGELNDLWVYKTLSPGNRGRNVIKRVRNYKPVYTIYLMTKDNKIFTNAFNSLQNPLRIPSLGMDDDIVNISDVTVLTLSRRQSRHVHSTIPYDPQSKQMQDYSINSLIDERDHIITPRDNLVNRSFEADSDEKNGQINKNRFGVRDVIVREFYNCYVTFEKPIDVYLDEELKYSILFH